MTVTVAGVTFTANNGDANDVTPVKAAFNTLATNDANLKTKVDNLLKGWIEDGTSLILNKNFTGSPTANLTLEFERGSGTNAVLRWNETTDAFEFNFANTFYNPLFPNLGVNYRSGSLPVWVNASTVQVQADYRAMDSTGKRIIAPAGALNVVLSGSGALGLDTGSEASDTWYYLWLCEGSSGVTAIFSTSATSPTLPTGYTDYKALVGEYRNNGSSNLNSFIYVSENQVRLNDTVQVVSASAPTSATAVSCISAAPPNSKAVILFVEHYNSTGGGSLYFTPNNGTEFDVGSNSVANLSRGFEITIPTNATPAFTWRVGGGSAANIRVLGYIK